MSEQFILQYIPVRMKELGYSQWHIRYRDFLIDPFNPFIIEAYNELFFIIDSPADFIITSDYGNYSQAVGGSDAIPESIYQHRGEISILNTTSLPSRLRMIQVIIVN